ncbi:MAG TPA: sulfotransferase, partial [Actinomycetes bacterium]|nr:sulfotransferase [Actinomycetes bacterium]
AVSRSRFLTTRPYRHEYRRWVTWDRGGGPEDTVVIAGSGRSGTTWVEEIANAGHWARVMFEPFRVSEVPELRSVGAYTYLRPGDTRYVSVVGELLSGHPRHNRWINHQNFTRISRRRIVKEIRAHCMLGWLADAFPQTTIVFAVRHPVTVVASQQRMGWRAQVEHFVSQPDLVTDHLASLMPTLSALDTPTQQLAAQWCIENLVSFRTLGPSRATLVPYERLAADPAEWTGRILGAVGRADEASALREVGGRPSKMARTDSVVKHGGDVVVDAYNRVPEETRRQVLEVVEACGFGELYGDDPVPNVDVIERYWKSGDLGVD